MISVVLRNGLRPVATAAVGLNAGLYPRDRCFLRKTLLSRFGPEADGRLSAFDHTLD